MSDQDDRKSVRDDVDPDKDRVIHEYDGIQEYDNRLPNWWLYTLYGSVVFAAVYWIGYHTLRSFDLPRAEYDQQAVAAQARYAEQLKTSGSVTPEALTALSHDPTTVAQGKEIFTTNCAACHKADGSGLIGPNLTDGAWMHGGKADQIYKTINDGVPDKQMPTWGPVLGPQREQAVTAFVLSIRDTNVPGGKAVQGNLIVN